MENTNKKKILKSLSRFLSPRGTPSHGLTAPDSDTASTTADSDASVRVLPPDSVAPSLALSDSSSLQSPGHSSSQHSADMPSSYVSNTTKPTTVWSLDSSLNAGGNRIAVVPGTGSARTSVSLLARRGSSDSSAARAGGPPGDDIALQETEYGARAGATGAATTDPTVPAANAADPAATAPTFTKPHPRHNPHPFSAPNDNASMVTLASSSFAPSIHVLPSNTLPTSPMAQHFASAPASASDSSASVTALSANATAPSTPMLSGVEVKGSGQVVGSGEGGGQLAGNGDEGAAVVLGAPGTESTSSTPGTPGRCGTPSPAETTNAGTGLASAETAAAGAAAVAAALHATASPPSTAPTTSAETTTTTTAPIDPNLRISVPESSSGTRTPSVYATPQEEGENPFYLSLTVADADEDASVRALYPSRRQSASSLGSNGTYSTHLTSYSQKASSSVVGIAPSSLHERSSSSYYFLPKEGSARERDATSAAAAAAAATGAPHARSPLAVTD